MIEAELPDGTILEFPDGTDQAVIQRVVRQQLGVEDEQAVAQPALDQEGVGMDILKSGVAGTIKGAVGGLSIPEMAARGILRTGQEALQYAGFDVGEDIPVLDTYTGAAGEYLFPKAYEYQPQRKGTQILGTAAEFVGGGGGLGAAAKGVRAAAAQAGKAQSRTARVASAIDEAGTTAKGAAYGAVAGSASEAAGQAMEGSGLEGVARVGAALFAPSAAASVVNTASKSVKALAGKNLKAPSTQTIEQERKLRFQELDDDGFVIPATDVDDMIDKAIAAGRANKADARLDDAFNEASKKLEEFRGKDMPLSLWHSLSRKLGEIHDPSRPHVLAMMKAMDDKLDDFPESAKLSAAKDLYKKESKVKALEEALKKAKDATSVSGSGGNKVNNFRRAVLNVMNDRKQGRFFSDTERAAMQRIVDGSIGENMMRLVGKMAPSGNGLMTYLNFVTAAVQPAFLIPTLGAMGIKSLSERNISKAVKELRDMLAVGGVPREAVTRDTVLELLGAQGMVPSMVSGTQSSVPTLVSPMQGGQ